MDTHTIFLNLRKSGFTIDHSEAILGAIKESGQQCDFATRSDLKELRQELRLEMTHLEHRLINSWRHCDWHCQRDDVFRSSP